MPAPNTNRNLWIGLALCVVVLLVKAPLMFTVLGEHDQGSMIIDAVVYHHDGPDTLRKYAIVTSPAWTLPLSSLAGTMTAQELVVLTNVGGVICGGLICLFGYLLLIRIGASVGWALAGGAAVAFLPSTFYLSLYGYPSQYALMFLLLAALTFATMLRAVTLRDEIVWGTITGIAFCLLALMKIDFAIAGTFLIGVAIVMYKWRDTRTLVLPLIAALAYPVYKTVVRLTVGDDDRFADVWRRQYPWDGSAIFDASAITILYSCGLGAVILFAAAILWGLVKQRARGTALTVATAWVVAALPLWVFWLGHPPMSARHAAPGAIITALLAALIASHAWRWRFAPVLWFVAVIAINWTLGTPSLNFNYKPGGNLYATLKVQHRIHTVRADIADAISAKPERAKIIVGAVDKGVLDGINVLLDTEILMATRSASVSAVGSGQELVFTDADGNMTTFIPYWPAESLEADPQASSGYYAVWPSDVSSLTARGVDVKTFDVEAMFDQTR